MNIQDKNLDFYGHLWLTSPITILRIVDSKKRAVNKTQQATNINWHFRVEDRKTWVRVEDQKSESICCYLPLTNKPRFQSDLHGMEILKA